MGTEIKVWQLTDTGLTEILDDKLAATHVEKDLEDWIEKDTSLLGTRLLVIGRQYDIPGVGILDLLCIDEDGVLVVVEFKRDFTSRQAVAQILDYASWLNTVSKTEIEACAKTKLDGDLSEKFDEYFERELPPINPQNHQMLLVAPKLDYSAERIINYLAERHGIKINAIFFRYAKTSGNEEILIRTILVPDLAPPTPKPPVMTADDLLKMADEKRVRNLVEICRQLGSVTYEQPRKTYGGSFRYFKRRLILGVNVAGQRGNPAPGELVVWLPVYSLPQIVHVSEKEIREMLRTKFTAIDVGTTECDVKLKTPEQAQELVSIIQEWIKRPAPR